MSMFEDKPKSKKPLFMQLKEFVLSWTVVELSLSWVLGNIAAQFFGSLVEDIIFPFFGLDELSELTLTINGVLISYGKTLASASAFALVLVIAFATIKLVHHLRRQQHIKDEEEPDEGLEILRQMRDLLAEMNERGEAHANGHEAKAEENAELVSYTEDGSDK